MKKNDNIQIVIKENKFMNQRKDTLFNQTFSSGTEEQPMEVLKPQEVAFRERTKKRWWYPGGNLQMHHHF